MSILRPWPYAAKAVIQHKFDTDHLDIWITFRHPMDQTVKPANGLWICEIDSIVKAVTASAWQDAWTMLLTVDDIAVVPNIVTIEYNGPSPLLRTTWDKQWEPWGPILSTGTIPLAFGFFFGNEIDWAQAAAINTWYIISDANIELGEENKMTFQNNQELKIIEAGFYLATYYVSVETSIAGKHVLAGILKDGVPIEGGQDHYHFGRANEESPIPGSAIVLLAVDDKISVGVNCTDTGNPTLTVDHVGLTLSKTDGN